MHGYPTDESPDIGSNGNYVKEKQEAAQRAIAPGRDYNIALVVGVDEQPRRTATLTHRLDLLRLQHLLHRDNKGGTSDAIRAHIGTGSRAAW